MSAYHVGRITSVLTQTFENLIDMSDWANKSEAERRKAFLSRALAAICIKTFANTDDATAASSIVDEFGDGGIDAIFFDQSSDTFYFVQSKWNDDGNGSIDQSTSLKFVSGVRDILAAKLERFGQRTQKKQPEILSALRAARPIKIYLITAHTGEQPIGSHAATEITDLLNELNVPSLPELALVAHLRQSDVYAAITSLSEPPKINLAITLKNFGFIEKPFLSYYGQTSALEISGWWKDHGTAICTRNIRHFFQRSPVNEALRQSLLSQPDGFWYLNNGITVICDSLQKALTGAPMRDVGLFNCTGVSVVNGAQTVGVIGTSGALDPAAMPWVQVRIISLEATPSGFDRRITIATNFQNAVSARDFVSMDPHQQRIATDFALDKRRYVYKSGEDDPQGAAGCSITEATQALGCADSMEMSVLVKRNLGELWADVQAAPYTTLFNERLRSEIVWRAVQIMRAVDEELLNLRGIAHAKADLVGVNLNRALLSLVFRDPRVRDFRKDGADEAYFIASARAAINEIFPRAIIYVEDNHPSEYLASVCKNTDKCVALGRALMTPQPAPQQSGPAGQISLFQ